MQSKTFTLIFLRNPSYSKKYDKIYVYDYNDNLDDTLEPDNLDEDDENNTDYLLKNEN